MSGHRKRPDEHGQHQINLTKLIGSRRLTQEDIVAASPARIPTQPDEQFRLFVETLYHPSDVVELKSGKQKQAGGKPLPCGRSVRLSAKEWADHAATGEHLGLLPGCLGTFIRINPVKSLDKGSGIAGETTDEDIADSNYCLIEHDDLSFEEQLALLASLRLPLAAIVDSGGRSLHGWIKVSQGSLKEYDKVVGGIYFLLNHFGFDSANKNVSRLARAPGFKRVDQSGAVRQQTLLYLDPNPGESSIIDRMSNNPNTPSS